MHLSDIHSIRQWQMRHRKNQPVEFHAWDTTLMVWMMGWIGWLPAYALDQAWALPLCLLGMLAPDLYVSWRARWHRRHTLRCDWLPVVTSLPRRPHVGG